MIKIISSVLLSCVLVISGCIDNKVSEEAKEKRAEILEHLLKTYSSDKDDKPQDVPIWEHWLQKTGELPPDFDMMKSIATPSDLLQFENGKTVTSPEQWQERKKEIRKALEQYMFGNWPEPPGKIAIKYQETPAEDNILYTKHNVQLLFAPTEKALEYADKNFGYGRIDYCYFMAASLNVELYVPKRKKPFPAIIELGPSRETISAQDLERLKRGYVVCRFNRKDADFIPGVYINNECNQLEWWAFAATRCVDLLYSRDDVDKSKIAIAGHSRGAKTALIAAVMDERIKAVINSHPGTGAGSYNLWRYTTDKYGGETLENSTRRFPYWNNQRMRFFIGRENKMPFDGHSLLSMMAPRPCLLGTGEHDGVGQAWGDQQVYMMVKEVYNLLGSSQKLGFYASPGGHEVTPVMINAYLDWLDMQFERKPYTFNDQLIYTYSFDEWKKIHGDELDLNEYPEKSMNDILVTSGGKEITTRDDWETKASDLRNQIKTIIGEIPERDKINNITVENERKSGSEFMKAEIKIDDKLIARLTYPAEKKSNTPVVIYLHAYLDANGYNWSRGYGYSTSVGERLAQNGFLAVEFDQFGYGVRNKDAGIEFYLENKNTSALGVMISDVSRIIDALSLIGWVDKSRIMVSGYSLGGMVALYSAAFDPRIRAVATTCGFASMRMDAHGNETEGIKRYSHLRSTIPKLGLFLGKEKRIPYDFYDVLGLIAPRPVYILAPELDQDWFFEDVEICFNEAVRVYDLYGAKNNIRLDSPNDFNRFPPEYQEAVGNWFAGISGQSFKSKLN